jgi:hypothetical protein
MRCPTCQKAYDDPALRYCLDDGAQLQPTHARFDRDAPTLKIESPPTSTPSKLENLAISMWEELEGADRRIRTAILLQNVIIITTDKPLSALDIFAISPRFMSQAEVNESIKYLLSRGLLETKSDANAEPLYSYPLKGKK